MSKTHGGDPDFADLNAAQRALDAVIAERKDARDRWLNTRIVEPDGLALDAGHIAEFLRDSLTATVAKVSPGGCDEIRVMFHLRTPVANIERGAVLVSVTDGGDTVRRDVDALTRGATGESLRHLRERLGADPRRVCRALEITPDELNARERGDVTLASRDLAIHVTAVVMVSAEENGW